MQGIENADQLYLTDWRRVPQPVCVAPADGVFGTSICGDEWVVAVVSGRATLFAGQCAHRGAALKHGWVSAQKDSLVCPYHGFEWSPTGELLRAPAYSRRGLRLPCEPAWTVPTTPLVERYGLLWAVPDPSSFPLEDIPLPSGASYTSGPFHEAVIHAGCGRSVEGTVDTYHIAFTHRASIGDPALPEAPVSRVRRLTQNLLYTEFELEQTVNASAGSLASERTVSVQYQQWWSTNYVYLLKTSPAGRYGLFFAYRVVGAHLTYSYRLILRDYAHDAPHERFASLEDQIDAEDRLILHDIQPVLIDVTDNRALHTPFDAPTAAYRRMMSEAGFRFI